MEKINNFYVVLDTYLLDRQNVMDYLAVSLEEVGVDPYEDVVYWGAWPSAYAKAEDVPPEELEAHKQSFIEAVKANEPTVIALGNNAGVLTDLLKKPSGILKVRGRATDYHGTKLIASMSPSMVLYEPVNEDDFKSDLLLAVQGAERYEFEIIDITDPNQIEHLLAACERTGICAYDWETTDKDPVTAVPTTCSFCTGDKTADGKLIVWFWMRLDKLVPCFDAKTEKRFKKEWGKFFKRAGVTHDLIAHNSKFDDWITENYIGFKIWGSTYDTQILKWNYNNIRPHGLKETVAKYLGVPCYDLEIDEGVKALAKRRGLVLSHPDDLAVLEWLGKEPERKEKTLKSGEVKVTLKWPENLDKKICSYAMLEPETVRLYNVKDAAYTFLLWQWFYPRIIDEGLGTSCDLRHIIGREMLRAEQRGLPLDVESNRAMESELVELEKVTKVKLLEALKAIPGIDESVELFKQYEAEEDEKEYKGCDIEKWLEEFNPNSAGQVCVALFGRLGEIPVFNRKALCRKGFTEDSVNKLADDLEEEAYGDFVDVKELLRNNEFNYDAAEEYLLELFYEKTGDTSIRVDFETKKLGLGGLEYDPVSFSKKTGNPGTGKVSLILLQNQKETDFINLILMYRKVTKMKTSFIDKIYRTLDKDGLTRTSYNITGTDSARISSSGNYNAQNWQKKIRGQIRPRDGYVLFSADAKAVEVRVLAAYCQDEGLLKAIYAEDTHRTVASIIFNKPPDQVTDDERKAGKITVFLTLYGGGAEKLSKFLNTTKSKAQKIINDFLTQFPDIAGHIKKQHALAATAPYYIYTAFGTRRSTKNILSDDNELRSKFERISVNSGIQGSAGELCLFVAHNVMEECREVGYNDYLADENLVWFVITVHDEITFEVHESICWAEEYEVEEKNKKTGKLEIVTKKRYVGPFVELFERVISNPIPFPPLDTVRFDFDYPIEYDSHLYWAQKPDLHGALESSSNPDEKFCWELIKVGLTNDMTEEMKEIQDEF